MGMMKETFIEAIEAIEKQLEYNIKVSEKLGEAFPHAFTANLLPDTSIILNAFITVLKEEMDDSELDVNGQRWIEWFCFETEFGLKKMEAYDENKKIIPMSNAGELYDFLSANIFMRELNKRCQRENER